MKLWQCHRYVACRLLDLINGKEGRCLEVVGTLSADSFIMTDRSYISEFVFGMPNLTGLATMKH